MRTVEDSFAHLEELGMRRTMAGPLQRYSYPSLLDKGRIEVLGDTARYYYVDMDYHVLQEVVQAFQMDEPYVEIGILEEAQNFVSRDAQNEEFKVPKGISFMVVRSTGAIGCMYIGRDTYCRGASFILRHSTCVQHLFPVVGRVFGPEADAYSIIQMAGERCLPNCNEILARLRSCPYEGQAAQLFLDGKASEILAALTHSIENLDKRAVPRYSPYERQAVQEIQKILRESVQNPPSLRTLAKQVGLNANKLQEVFRYYTGATVMDYLRSYRLERALALLGGSMLVDEVARLVGYRSPSSFSEAFAKAYGITPGKYRKLALATHGQERRPSA